MSEMINTYPKEIKYLINCGDLYHLYLTYIEPYLGLYKYYFEHDKALMGELYYRLEGTVHEGFDPITNMIDSDIAVYIPTDIQNYFFKNLETLLEALVKYIDGYIKNKLLIGINMYGGYNLYLTFVEYPENNNVNFLY